LESALPGPTQHYPPRGLFAVWSGTDARSLPTRGDYPDAGKTCLASILRRWLHEHGKIVFWAVCGPSNAGEARELRSTAENVCPAKRA
jgi:hypothetical protein